MYTDDELDNYIKSIVCKKITEPSEYDNVIRNAFKDKKSFYIKQKIMQLVPLICCMTIFMSGITYAKEIKVFFESLFTNSTEAIDIATQNGYVQNAETEYVYDNDIGIRVKDIVLDDANLNVSLEYEFSEKYQVENIRLYEYEMRDNNEQLLTKFDTKNLTSNEIPIINSVTSLFDGIFIDDNHYVESILYGADEFPEIKILSFKIKSLRLNEGEIIYGEWNLSVEIDEKFNKRDVIEYEANNEHVIDSKITLSETTLNVYIELDEKYEFEDKDINKIKPRIEMENGKQYFLNNMTFNNLENGSKYNINFYFSKYYENIEKLYFIINLSNEKEIKVELNKK